MVEYQVGFVIRSEFWECSIIFRGKTVSNDHVLVVVLSFYVLLREFSINKWIANHLNYVA